MRNYAYGLLASMILTGGVAIYYSSNPGIGVTADDVAELMEGYNERVFAISTNRTFTNGNWSISVYTNLASLPVHAQMQSIMDGIPTLCANYVQSYTATSVVYWTASNLFIAAGIGPTNGQLKYTVAFATNGAPVYSNKLGQLIITNTLWECYRALSNLTITARAPVWGQGQCFGYGKNNSWFMHAVYPDDYLFLKTDPEYPVWWTNIESYSWLISTGFGPNVYAMVDAGRIAYQSNGLAQGQAREVVTLTAPAAAQGSRGTWASDNQYWFYLPPVADAPETAYRLDSSGGVWLASMASGVTATVSIPWSVTQHWSGAFWDSGPSGFDLSGFSAGTEVVSVVFSGVATGLTHAATVKPAISLLPLIGGDYSAWGCNGVWSNVAGGGIYASNFEHAPPPRIDGLSEASLTGPIYIHWTFTRCRP